jgi:hypothetical protein
MSASDWVGLCVAILTLLTTFVGMVRWLVKHYLAELRPNSGGSLKDTVNRLEERVDKIYEILISKV